MTQRSTNVVRGFKTKFWM